MTPAEVLAAAMPEADSSGAGTVGEFLRELLSRLWAEGEMFSSKRPIDGDDWQWLVYIAIAKAVGRPADDPQWDRYDFTGDEVAVFDTLIGDAIRALPMGLPAAEPQRSPITVHGRAVDIGTELGKRFYIPGVTIKGDCPECGRLIVWPSHPDHHLYGNNAVGVPIRLSTGCLCGGDGIQVLATVRVTVDVTTMDGTPIEPQEP